MARKKSKVWTYFKETSSGSVKCNVCQKILSYCNNTTNLKNHLLAFHGTQVVSASTSDPIPTNDSDPDDPEPIVQTDVPSTSTSSEASSLTSGLFNTSASFGQSVKRKTVAELFKNPAKHPKQIQPNLQKRNQNTKADADPENDVCIKDLFGHAEAFSESKPKWNKLTDGLLYLICKDMLPLSFANGKGFIKFMKIAQPHYKIPGRKKITRLIDKKYDLLREKVTKTIQDAEYITLTTDIWTEVQSTTSYLRLTAHYYDSHLCSTKMVILGVEPLDEKHTANYIQRIAEKLLQDWLLPKEKVVACVTDSAANMKLAIKNMLGEDKHIACLAHLLNLVVIDAIDGTENIKDLIDKVKIIVTYFKQTVNAADQLRSIQKARGVAEGNILKLKQECRTRWNSTLFMLERFVELSGIVNGILLESPSGPAVIDASDLIRIKEIIKLLKPFKQATVELCGDQYATCSRVLQTLYCIRKSVSIFISTSNRGNNLKLNLLRGLNERFGDLERSTVHSVCTFVDPRFKKMHIESPVAAANVINKIAYFMKREVSEIGNIVPDPPSTSTNSDDDDDLWSHHSALMKNANSEPAESIGGLPLELRQYLAEKPADTKTNPFELWESELKYKYPVLYKITLKYLPIATTSVPSERLFSKAGNVITEKRARLKVTRLYKLLFLGSLPEDVWGF